MCIESWIGSNSCLNESIQWIGQVDKWQECKDMKLGNSKELDITWDLQLTIQHGIHLFISIW